MVAILDTGAQLNHPDFADRIVYQYDFSRRMITMLHIPMVMVLTLLERLHHRMVCFRV